jgi:hypothetical protein
MVHVLLGVDGSLKYRLEIRLICEGFESVFNEIRIFSCILYTSITAKSHSFIHSLRKKIHKSSKIFLHLKMYKISYSQFY